MMVLFGGAILVLFGVVQVRALQNPYCSLGCDYGDGGSLLHTVCERHDEKCGPGQHCGPDFREVEMTDDLRQYILDLHNEFRNRVASGNEVEHDQPSARKMMAFNYNRELEFIAQCWSNTCHGNPLVHDQCRGTKGVQFVGQNLGLTNSTFVNDDLKDVVRTLITLWYEEVRDFKKEWVGDTQDRGPNVVVGHYTQLLWSDTTEIGCGLTYYTIPNENYGTTEAPKIIDTPQGEYILLPPEINEKWHHYILACNYSPGGNYLGAPLYEVGEPCTGCPKNQPCGKYSALCGLDVPVNSSVSNFTPFFRF